MTLAELEKKSILILGFAVEGQATYEFLRRRWASKPLMIADRRGLREFPSEVVLRIQNDPAVTFSFGPGYLDAVSPHNCEVIIKTPGIPASIDRIASACEAGCRLTSHSQIFLSNFSREKVVGITGTKGKSTTASLIHHILRAAAIPAELVGNIGRPPLAVVGDAAKDAYFVHEFSSHQLAEITTSPHIAVLLNIVPEHLDYYSSFEAYVAAKENITKFQTADDFLVYTADYPIPREIASRSKASLKPFRLAEWPDFIPPVSELPLVGKFNMQNIVAAVTAASLCGVDERTVQTALRTFTPLPHRLERVGTYRGITFYDDSIATVPDATLAAVDALGPTVQTLILGGHERNLDFTQLGMYLPANIKTVILFQPTGIRIWNAIENHSPNRPLPSAFFVRDMEQAVRIAYESTAAGKICLLSPASPSFGTFKDYRERGELFKAFVRKLSSATGIR
jgi:UDP-N-acetylmuramoylalanine--D-glutamate ligase